MTSLLQTISIVASLLLLAFIFEMVRKRKLKENYSLTWFLVGLGFLLLSVFGNHLQGIASLAGFHLLSNAIIVYAIFLLLILILGLSVSVSKLSNQTETLVQEVAILKQKLEKEENQAESDEE